MSQAEIEHAAVGEIEIAYERFGDPDDPPVLLVMGLATQMLGWPDEFCAGLAAQGHFVVRFDNRDIGLSTHLHDAPPADLMAAFGGDTSSASYTLSDMARDTVGLLDALSLDSVHLVGASMGGMIAQTVAIEHPTRVRSLTSIMSTTGDSRVGQATQEALAALLAPAPTSVEEAMDRTVSVYRVIGSPEYEMEEDAVRERARRSYERAFDPAGVQRQMLAVLASGDRTERLRTLGVPTLVIHGTQDPLVGVAGGRATADAIPGAELVEIDGMGHDFPRELWPDITGRIAALVRRVEEGGGPRSER
jgi:pimeloyl-ACP methyl ester carboxylesterase